MIIGFTLLIMGFTLLVTNDMVDVNNYQLIIAGLWMLCSLCWILLINTFNENYMGELSTSKNNYIPDEAVFSLMIPWADTWQDEKIISEILNNHKLGKILKIYIVPKISKLSKIEYNQIFIHYKTWHGESADKIKTHLLKECDKQPEVRCWYSHTSFWNIRAMNWKHEVSDELSDIDNKINSETLDEADGEAIAADIMDGIVMWINEDKPKNLLTDTDIIKEASKIILKHNYFNQKCDVKQNSLQRIKHVLWLLEKTEDEISTLHFDNVWPIPYLEIIE